LNLAKTSKVANRPTAPLPALWTVEEYRGISRDANLFAVAYVYFERESGRRAAAKFMTEDETRKIAAGIAKLPELPGPAEALSAPHRIAQMEKPRH
jgi:hypothetical protein